MAIIGPADMPVVLRTSTGQNDHMKHYALSQLGYPNVAVEIQEPQLEAAIRVTGDFISGYFPKEQRLAVFYTSPMQPTYALPQDAYWIQEISWTPNLSSVDLIFSAESYLYSIASATGVQQLVFDFYLLQAYRRNTSHFLSTLGMWEVINETVDGGPGEQKIRLYPTPKGTFPVVVVYMPVVTAFRSPQAKMIAYEMLVAEVKGMVGRARRKIGNVPSSSGGTIGYDGDALVQESTKEKDEIIKKALQLGEPDQIVCW